MSSTCQELKHDGSLCDSTTHVVTRWDGTHACSQCIVEGCRMELRAELDMDARLQPRVDELEATVKKLRVELTDAGAEAASLVVQVTDWEESADLRKAAWDADRRQLQHRIAQLLAAQSNTAHALEEAQKEAATAIQQRDRAQDNLRVCRAECNMLDGRMEKLQQENRTLKAAQKTFDSKMLDLSTALTEDAKRMQTVIDRQKEYIQVLEKASLKLQNQAAYKTRWIKDLYAKGREKDAVISHQNEHIRGLKERMTQVESNMKSTYEAVTTFCGKLQQEHDKDLDEDEKDIVNQISHITSTLQ